MHNLYWNTNLNASPAPSRLLCKQVEEYLNTRVYGPDSGIYDIFELPHHFQSHSCVVMKLAFPGNEYIRFHPADGQQRVMEAAAARQDNNHTMQYLRRSALESRLLFRPTPSELQATTRIGFVDTNTQPNVEQQAPTGTTHNATPTGQPPLAPHQPRVRTTPEQERAELLRRAAEASKPNRGIWAYRVLGVMRDATQAVLKQVWLKNYL